MSRTAVSLAIGIVCSMPWAPVRADEPAALELTVHRCLRDIEPELRSILTIELATMAQIDDQTRDATLRAHVSCRRDSVEVRVERVDTGEVLEDRVATSPGAPATARAIALALTELVAATRPYVPPPPTPPEPEVAPPPEPVPFHLEIPWALDGAVVFRPGADHGPHMAGLRAGLSYFPKTFLRLSFGAEWLTGARGTPLGRVRSTALTADVAFGIGYTVDSKWIGADLGLRMGVMLWTGNDDATAVSSSRAAKPFVGLFGRVLGEWPIGDQGVRLRAAMEVGPVIVGSSANAIDTSGSTPVVIDTVNADRYTFDLQLGVTLAF